jgi:signal transduction histidine kinase
MRIEMEKINSNNFEFILVELPQNLSDHFIKYFSSKNFQYKVFNNFDEAKDYLFLGSFFVIALSHRFLNFLSNSQSHKELNTNYFFLIYQYFDDLDILASNYSDIQFDFVNIAVSPELSIHKIDNFIYHLSRMSKVMNNLMQEVSNGISKENIDLEKLYQNLELKLLQTEIKEEQLEKELIFKKIYEGELTRLNNNLQEQAIKINDLNKELKNFTYSVTHDIKAPLRGIIGYSQELLKRHSDGLSDRAKFCIQQIDSAAHGLEKLIQDLLLYSKIEFDLPTAIDVNIKEIVEKILSERTNEINNFNTKILLNLESVEIKCWERGLYQALSNLIDNAIKYSSKSSSPEVIISSNEINDKVLISVKDNGIGFDMIYHDKIFELFHRLADHSIYEGTGAGLSIVKRLVTKMNGKIWAESEINNGSTFFIELPKK